MSQYRDGKVIVTNGSAVVRSAYEALLTGAVSQFLPQSLTETAGALRFLTSGARAHVLSHVLAQQNLVFDRNSGTPVLGETIEGPNVTNVDGGTATSGGASTLTDTTKSWGDDIHIGRWLGIRVGEANAEWRKITDNTGTVLTVDSAWTSQPALDDTYGIYDPATATLRSWRRGSPQDFVSAGVVAGNYFVAESNVPIAIQSGISALQFTLATAWGGASVAGVPFTIHRDWTSRGFPILAAGDAKPNVLMGLLAQRIDTELDLSWSSLSLEAGWAHDGSENAQYTIDAHGWVMLRGGATKGSPSPPDLIAVLPAGYLPARRLYFSVIGNTAAAIVSVDTDGSVRYESGSSASPIFLQQIGYYAAG